MNNDEPVQTWKINIFLVLLGITTAVLVAEVSLRLFYTVEPFELGEIEEWNPLDDSGFTPKLNELRFREDPVDSEILDERYTRVLFLGDSFTFGQGVSDGRDRFSDILEAELNGRLAGQYHIYNASRPGTEPVDWLQFYRQVQPEYMPDHVVAIFFLRDGTNLCTSLRCYEEVLAEIKSEYSSRLLYKYSAVARFYFDQAIRREFSTFYAEQIQNAYLSDETEIWQQQQAALQHIQALCQENGSSFDLVIFPILFDLNENYPFHEVESEILRFANMANIPAFSLTSGFLGQSAEDLWVSPNDQHPNELGHKIAAETLLPFLIEILGNRNRLHND